MNIEKLYKIAKPRSQDAINAANDRKRKREENKIKMTEKELLYKTNKELSMMLDKIIEETKTGLITIDYASTDKIKLFEEISKRLRIEPHITFNDAQFDL